MTLYRLEAWHASIRLSTCTEDEYAAAVSCSDPVEIERPTRAAMDATLDAIEKSARPDEERRTVVEAFLYLGSSTSPHACYRRARDGSIVLADSPEAL